MFDGVAGYFYCVACGWGNEMERGIGDLAEVFPVYDDAFAGAQEGVGGKLA
jgi:hypothetical protein